MTKRHRDAVNRFLKARLELAKAGSSWGNSMIRLSPRGGGYHAHLETAAIAFAEARQALVDLGVPIPERVDTWKADT